MIKDLFKNTSEKLLESLNLNMENVSHELGALVSVRTEQSPFWDTILILRMSSVVFINEVSKILVFARKDDIGYHN